MEDKTMTSAERKLDEITSLVSALLERSNKLMPLKAFKNFDDALLFVEALGRLRKAARGGQG